MNRFNMAKIILLAAILLIAFVCMSSCQMNTNLPDNNKSEETTSATTTKAPYTPDIPGLGKVENDTHCFEEWEYISEPTCEESGSVKLICVNCNEERIEPVAALGHNKEQFGGREATCTENGETPKTVCTVCDALIEPSEVIPATGHTEKVVAGKPATCTESGYTDSIVCEECGFTVKESTQIDPVKHDYLSVLGKAPTCTEDGLTEKTFCRDCGEVLKEAEVIPATGHKNVHVPGSAPDCTTVGYTDSEYCDICKAILTDRVEIPALGHTPERMIDVAPTCTESGYMNGEYCKVCNETLAAPGVIDPLGHTPKTIKGYAATCTASGLTDGEYCSVCSEVLLAQTIIEPVAHTPATLEGYDATCTTSGLTGGEYCSVCNQILSEQVTINPLGHTTALLPGVAPTCTEKGLTEGTYCSVCNEILLQQTEIDPLGHTSATVAGYAATCTASGLTNGEYCSVCQEILVAQSQIAPLRHTPAILQAKVPTCVEEGLSEGKYCSVCNEILLEQTKLPLTKCQGEWVVTLPATESTVGVMSMTCATCGKIETDEVPCSPYTAGLEYELSNGYYILVGIGHATDTDINIPLTYRGLPVAKIAAGALKDQTQITSITVSDNIIHFGYAPFAGCTGLVELTVPFLGDVKRTIEEDDHYPLGYFFGTTNVEGAYACEQIVGERNAAHSEVVFYIPRSLKKVTVNGGDIHTGAFNYCTLIEELVFGDAVRCVEKHSLTRCDGLKNLTLPYLGLYTEEITDGSKYFNNLAYMFGLSDVIYGRVPTNTVTVKVTKGIGGFAIEYHGIRPFENGIRLIIGKDIERIKEECGYMIYSKNLISVTFEEGSQIKEIWCIGYQYGITEPLIIPASVERIGDIGPTDFYVTDLEKFMLGFSGSLDGDIYYNGELVTEVVLPTGMASSHLYNFENCTSIKKIYVSPGVNLENITWGDSIEEIVFLPGVKVIPERAFIGCQNLKTVYLPNSLHTIGEMAFYNCYSLKEVKHIPNDTSVVETSSDSVFSINISDGALEYLYIPASVTHVLELNDSKIIEIGEGCTNIEFDYVYLNSLEEFYLPDSLKIFTIELWSSFGTGTKIYIGSDLEKFNALISNFDLQIHAESMADYVKVDFGVAYPFEAYINGDLLCGDIVVPNSVEKIGQKAFWGSVNMTSLKLPSTIRYIGEEAFREYFSDLYIEDVGSWCLIEFANFNANPMSHAATVYISGTKDIETLVIPEGITEIKGYAFINLAMPVALPSTLTQIGDCGLGSLSVSYIPNSVKYIGNDAIQNTNGSLNKLPDSLEYIGNNAIRTTVNNVHIGKSLTHIGYCAFVLGEGAVTVVEDHQRYKAINGLLIDMDTLTAICVLDSRTDFVIPDQILYLAPYLFSNRILQSVTLNNGLVEIGEYAFYGCKVDSIVIPNSVTKLGAYAFAYANLENIVIGSGMDTIPMGCFSNCGIKNVTVPQNITFIDSRAFSNSALESVTFESTRVQINYNAFGECYQLKAFITGDNLIQIPTDLLELEKLVFTEYENGKYLGTEQNPYRIFVTLIDKSVQSVSIHPDTVVINTAAFYGSALVSVSIPSKVTHIGESAFFDSTELKSVSLPNSLVEIAGFAFYGTPLTAVDIPDSVKSIGTYAFAYTGITSIVLPKDLEFVGDFAFAHLSLTSATFGNAVFEANNRNNNESQVFGQSTIDHITIYEGITKIPDFAFKDFCYGLKSVTLPESLVEIGEGAFYGTSLTSIVIPGGVKYIPDYAFQGCPLVSVQLPEGLLEIGNSAFYGAQFTKLDLPTTLIKIEEYAFANSSLEEICLGKGILEVGDNVFWGNTLKSISIFTSKCAFADEAFGYCDIEVVNIDNIEDWISNTFTSFDATPIRMGTKLLLKGEPLQNIVIPEGTESICAYAFRGVTTIQSLSIPGSLKSVGEFAFVDSSIECVYINNLAAYLQIDFANIEASPTYYAKGIYVNGKPLTSLVIPAGVTEIKPYAFASRPYLSNPDQCIGEIVFSNSVVKIGKEAFCGLDYLSKLNLANVQEIGEGAFRDCKRLAEIIIPDSVTVIGDEAFANISQIDSVTLGNGLVKIGVDAFKNSISTGGFGGVSRLNLPSIELLGRIEFGNANSIPGSYESYVLYINGELVEELKLTGINTVYAGMFDNLSVKTVIVPVSVTKIEASAFENSSIETLIFEAGGACEIEKNAFAYCSNLKNVVLYAAKVKEGAFSFCPQLESFTVKSNGTVFEDLIFGYSSIQTLIIDGDDVILNEKTFARCYVLNDLQVRGKNLTVHPKTFYGFYNYQVQA